MLLPAVLIAPMCAGKTAFVNRCLRLGVRAFDPDAIASDAGAELRSLKLKALTSDDWSIYNRAWHRVLQTLPAMPAVYCFHSHDDFAGSKLPARFKAANYIPVVSYVLPPLPLWDVRRRERSLDAEASTLSLLNYANVTRDALITHPLPVFAEFPDPRTFLVRRPHAKNKP